MVYGKRKVLSFTTTTEHKKLKTHVEKCLKYPPKANKEKSWNKFKYKNILIGSQKIKVLMFSELIVLTNNRSASKDQMVS